MKKRSSGRFSPINILSIDWDYFIGASAEQRYEMFPDGCEDPLISSQVQSVIWSTHYASNPKIKDLGVLFKPFNVYKYVLGVLDSAVRRNPNMIAMMADSHEHAYKFIDDNLSRRTRINLVNIDFHHDVYNNTDSTDVNCGNWLERLMGINTCSLSKFTWVCRDDSDISNADPKSFHGHKFYITNDIKSVELDRTDWDMVFICRSGAWSPLHLDKYFIDMCNTVIKAGTESKVEVGILESRYTKEMRKLISQNRAMIKNCVYKNKSK